MTSSSSSSLEIIEEVHDEKLEVSLTDIDPVEQLNRPQLSSDQTVLPLNSGYVAARPVVKRAINYYQQPDTDRNNEALQSNFVN